MYFLLNSIALTLSFIYAGALSRLDYFTVEGYAGAPL